MLSRRGKVTGVALLLIFLVSLKYCGNNRIRANGELLIGMSEDEAEQVYGEAAGEIAVGTCACAYYEPWPSLFGEPVAITSPRVQSISELPTFYDAMQMLFDKDGKLIAYDWNGECIYTRTVDGEFRSTGKGLAALADTIGAYCN